MCISVEFEVASATTLEQGFRTRLSGDV